jgi:hypothetical protein
MDLDDILIEDRLSVEWNDTTEFEPYNYNRGE